MSNERDTKFSGFAELLMNDIENVLHLLDNPDFVSSGMNYEIKKIIAQRAYDLVAHILSQTPAGHGYINYFEDMHAWPEQERFANALADLAKIHEKLQRD